MFRRERLVQTKLNKLLDGALFGVAFWLAHWIRARHLLDPEGLIHSFGEYSWLLLVVVPVTPPLLELEGFYRRQVVYRRGAILFQAIKAAVWVAIGIVFVLFLRKHEGPRGVPFIFVPIAGLLLLAKEEVFRIWAVGRLGKRGTRKRVIILGGSDSEEERGLPSLEVVLGLDASHDIEIVAKLDVRSTSPQALADRLHQTSANAVVVSPRQAPFGLIEQAIQVCELEGVEVWLVANFFQTRIAQTSADELNGHPVLVFRTGPEASWHVFAKEVVDFVGAAILLLIASPVMIAAAISVKLGSPGPVFFRQQRAGLNGRPFTMLKFRTMVSNAEQLKQELAALNEMSGPVFKVTNDPRVTRGGKFLRKWSIDELPQLINVLQGEMSLVGPRPLPVDEVARFDDPAHRRRLSVKPGLTCLWQIGGRSNVRDFKEWVRLDLEYIDHWTFWLDLKILVLTVPAVFTGAGAK
jgi:exopolysaccharide biosynthesis polyprenyl glycosylphosphotransferase